MKKPEYQISVGGDAHQRKELEMPEDLLSRRQNELKDFCDRWKIVKLELFGSALREDFSAKSDFDFLVTFAKDAKWSLFDFFKMQDEMEKVLKRKVDLFTRRSVEQSTNPYRKKEILDNAKPIFVS